jgi:hypothetical protein
MCEILAKLEEWKYAHKSRAVEISHDDGYGSGPGWEVTLHGKERKKVVAYETGIATQETPKNVVFASEDWIGISATIAVALRKAEELGL